MENNRLLDLKPPNLKHFLFKKNIKVSTNTFTVFTVDKIETSLEITESVDDQWFLECSNCGRELGKVTDENISFQFKDHAYEECARINLRGVLK